MKKKKNIVWLASYPKSGNTWMRIFLANYLLNADTPVPINQIHRIGIGDAIVKTYNMVARAPFDPDDPNATLRLRPAVLNAIVGNGADVNLVKTHNTRASAFGHELIPVPLTRAAIYILRNPLDLVLSYARHYGQTPAEAAEALGRADNTTIGDKNSVKQFLGNWSEHVNNWTRHKKFPVVTLRYEDMEARPEDAFSKALELIGVTPDPDRLARAIRFSSFDEVKSQEAKSGFVERSRDDQTFFHTGHSGQWRDRLEQTVIDQIVKDHGKLMKRCGYL